MERFAFAGRTCVLSGAAGGIGAALAMELAKRRMVLVLIDKDAAGLERVARLAREVGAAEVSTYVIDLSDGGDRLDLAAEVAARVALAGLEIVEVRISSLAYAPEIAQAMLQRQQAGAVIAAREQIVEGAVTMVDQALKRLETDDIVTMDDERRAQMVSNLLVVLCSDQRTQPVVNTGSLYA